MLIKAPEEGPCNKHWSQGFRAGIVTGLDKDQLFINDTYDSFEDGWPSAQDRPYPIKDCTLLIKKDMLPVVAIGQVVKN